MSYPIYYPRQYKDYAEASLRILRSGETGIILVPPNTHKSSILIDKFIHDTQTGHEMVKLDLATVEMDKSEDFNLFVKSARTKTKKKKLALFIINAQILVDKKKYQLLNYLLEYEKHSDQISLIFYFSIDLTHPDIAKHLKSSIYGNIIYFPLYSLEDSKDFIQVLEKEWNLRLTDEQVVKIAVCCGGYFWLVKQVMRVLRDNPDIKVGDTILNSRVKLALEQFYNALFLSEQKVLQNVILGRKIEDDTEKHSLHYLQKIGLIEENKICVPFLENFIRNYLPQLNIEMRDSHIFINSVNIDSHFSQKEKRVFKTMIDRKNQLVSRDDLAKSIWPINTEDYYSDWAVDRIMARLRLKITSLGFSKEIIKTERGKGYIFVG